VQKGLDGQFIIRVYHTAKSVPGNYAFSVLPKCNNENLVKLTFNVKVVKNTKEPSINLKAASGSFMDLLEGENAKIMYLPTLKNMEGTILNVTTLEGESMFQSELLTVNGSKQIKISLKVGNEIFAGKAYVLPLNVEVLDKGNNQTHISTTVTIQPKEGKLEVTSDKADATFCRKYTYNSVTIENTITTPEQVEIASITNISKGIPDDTFKVSMNPKTGQIRITLVDKNKATKSKYQFKFRFQAGNGTKGTVKSYTIQII
jgi:hypothetical protein